jgi:hypothetical protein
MAQPALETRIKDRANTILQWDINAILHPKEAGGFSFDNQKELLDYVRTFYADVASAHFTFVPPNVLEEIATGAERVIQSLSQLQNFNYREGNAGDNHNRLGSTLQGNWFEAYNRTAPHLAFARSASGALAHEIQALQSAKSTLQSQLATAAAVRGVNP